MLSATTATASPVVRTLRYALALSLKGTVLEPDVFALHSCDDPICVRVTTAEEVVQGLGAHVMGGDLRENMRRMALMRRGGWRQAILTRDAGAAARAERSRAIRAAVAEGWNAWSPLHCWARCSRRCGDQKLDLSSGGPSLVVGAPALSDVLDQVFW